MDNLSFVVGICLETFSFFLFDFASDDTNLGEFLFPRTSTNRMFVSRALEPLLGNSFVVYGS